MELTNEAQVSAQPEEQPTEVAPQPGVAASKLTERMRKESAVHQERQRRKERDLKLEKAEQILQRLGDDPMGALELAGHTKDDLKKFVSDTGSDDKVSQLEQRLDQVISELEKRQRREEEGVQQKDDQEVLDLLSEFVESKSDEYPGLSVTPGINEQIKNLIVSAYENDGTVLSEAEAAQQLEQRIFEYYKTLFGKYGDITEQGTATEPSPTLTNTLSADKSGRAPGNVKFSEMSDEDILRRRLAILEQHLG